MSLPFFKADTDEVIESLTTREWSKDRRPMPFECRMEASAVVAADLVGQWSKKRWGRRWCCHHTTVERRLSEVFAFMDEHGGDEWWAPVEGRRRSRRDVFLRAYPFVEGSESRTPSAPRAHPERTPSAPPEPDAVAVVDEQAHPERTPSAPRAHPERTHHARVSPETGDGRRERELSPKPPQPPAEGAPAADPVQLDLVSAKPPARVLEETLNALGVKLSSQTRSDLVRRGWTTPEALASLPPTRAEPGQPHLSLVTGMGKRTRERLRDALRRAGLVLAQDPKPDGPGKDPRTKLVTDLWAEVHRGCLGVDPTWDGNFHRDRLRALQVADTGRVHLSDPDQGLSRVRVAFEAYLGDLQAPENWPHEPTLTGFAHPQRLAGRFTGRAIPRRRGEINLSAFGLALGADHEPDLSAPPLDLVSAFDVADA